VELWFKIRESDFGLKAAAFFRRLGSRGADVSSDASLNDLIFDRGDPMEGLLPRSF